MAPTPLQFRVMAITLVSVGLVTTALRLFIRHRNRSLWWDDFWAAFAGVLAALLVATSILHTTGSLSIPEQIRIACYYMCAQFYYAAIWSSRLSILYTIVRLSTGRLRLFLIISSFLFLTFWMILLAQVFWICESDGTDWKHKTVMPECPLGISAAIAQTITVVFGDSILVLSPIKVVWGSKLSKIVKIRLVAVFASTIAMTITSLVYINALLTKPGVTEQYMSIVHAGVSLLVANLAVIVGFIFKSRLISSSVDLPGPAHDNTKSLRRDLRLTPPQDSATSLDPSLDTACIEVHIEHDPVIDISAENSNMIKTVYLKSPTSGVGDDSADADSRSSMHDPAGPDEKV